MISMIIVTFNKLDYTKLCIDSIRQHTAANSYELIVVDNGSTDGTVDWLREQPDLRVICNQDNAGFPAACNQGIRAAEGNHILLLNNDTIVTPGWLSNLSACLFSAADIGAVSAVTNSCSNFQNVPCEYSCMEELIAFARQMNHADPSLWEERERLVGYCLLVKAEVVAAVGLLDEIFSPGNFEDDDYSVRIRQAGYRMILCRDVFIHHFGSVSFKEPSIKFTTLLQTNKQKFIEKWGYDPHSRPSSQAVEDPVLKGWFAYQHDVNHFRQVIQAAYRKFSCLVSQAEFSLLTGNYEKALTLVMQAADYAHHCHPGLFASHRLEAVLRKIAGNSELRPATPLALLQHRTSGKRQVLHVLSQGYAAVGHTKVLERWMTADAGSVHSVLVTLNSDTNPPVLAAAAQRSGGWYVALDKMNASLCQRALLLRDLAAMWADLVVLHIHPHDPLPAVAFGAAGKVPVIFVNHADQGFTIGMSTADLVAEHWTSGQLISQNRRIFPRSCMLPLPLGELPEPGDKQAAKRGLGITDSQLVCLTVTQPYRVTACGEYDFIKLLRKIHGRQPETVMLVIGIAESEEWKRLREESNQCIRCAGIPADAALYYNAADIYLDSIPLGAPEEALAAGARGIPVIGLANCIAEQFDGILAADGIKTHVNTEEELLAGLDTLLTDEEYRFTVSRSLQNSVRNHCCHGWNDHLETLYSLLPAKHTPVELAPTETVTTEKQDIIWSYFQHRSGLVHSRFS
ncbi:glycosyltransferase [Propionispora hippei]|uniref:Glycosyltransferase, GT2 family n=1 Tax=Propionispora hippei DSM 15287 TaxID=1123003 RepID=A0A1M6G3K3_9FIRM|nr:glycosyltransferase [Propionispora hippei]SHJ04447.1 Glycosyltransferase, GT2 family [Propionispora hippei DSM 15287]